MQSVFHFFISSFFAFSLVCLSLGCSEDFARDLGQRQQEILFGEMDDSLNHEGVVFIALSTLPNEVLCTGTLIDENYVLTAAHCTTDIPSSLHSLLAVGRGQNSENAENLISVEQVMVHEKFFQDQTWLQNDIALLKLSSPMGAEQASPILPLPPEIGVTQEEIQKQGLSLTIVGFGKDEHGEYGQRLKVSVQAKMYCGGLNAEQNSPEIGCNPGEVTISENGHSYVASTRMPYGSFFYLQYERGPCAGDSGGPALIMRNGQEYVVGITSFGDQSCTSFGVSTAIQDYWNWICERVPGLSEKVLEAACQNKACEKEDNSCSLSEGFNKKPHPNLLNYILFVCFWVFLRRKYFIMGGLNKI